MFHLKLKFMIKLYRYQSQFGLSAYLKFLKTAKLWEIKTLTLSSNSTGFYANFWISSQVSVSHMTHPLGIGCHNQASLYCGHICDTEAQSYCSQAVAHCGTHLQAWLVLRNLLTHLNSQTLAIIHTRTADNGAKNTHKPRFLYFSAVPLRSRAGRRWNLQQIISQL